MKEIFLGSNTEIHYTGNSGSILISRGCDESCPWPSGVWLSTYAMPCAEHDVDTPWGFFWTRHPKDLRAIAAGLNAAADAMEEDNKRVDMT